MIIIFVSYIHSRSALPRTPQNLNKQEEESGGWIEMRERLEENSGDLFGDGDRWHFWDFRLL